MAKVHAPFPVIGTFRCGITFYEANGENLARKTSSLSSRRVKTSAAFANTRFHANILGQASGIGSAIYKALPAYFKQSWMFRSFTGEAMQLLKAGKTKEETTTALWKLYVEEHENREARYEMPRAERPKKRTYTKTATTYWQNKTAKANKRKAQKEKLQHYAGLLAKASKIGSALYQSLPAEKRVHWKYRMLTGLAMQMLKEETEEEEVTKFLEAETCQPDKQTGEEIKNKPVKYIPILKMDSIVCVPRVQSSSQKRRIKRRLGRLRLSLSSFKSNYEKRCHNSGCQEKLKRSSSLPSG